MTLTDKQIRVLNDMAGWDLCHDNYGERSFDVDRSDDYLEVRLCHASGEWRQYPRNYTRYIHDNGSVWRWDDDNQQMVGASPFPLFDNYYSPAAKRTITYAY